jgi:hypothetical protein
MEPGVACERGLILNGIPRFRSFMAGLVSLLARRGTCCKQIRHMLIRVQPQKNRHGSLLQECPPRSSHELQEGAEFASAGSFPGQWIVPLPIETFRGPGRASGAQSDFSGGTKISEGCRSRALHASCARSEAPRADRKDRNEEREEEKGASRIDPDCSSAARESCDRHRNHTRRGLHLSIQQERQGLASIHRKGVEG